MVTYVGYSTIGSITSSITLVDKDIALRDLMNHIYTRKGERVMHPDFGCIVWDLLFEPVDKMVEGEISRDIERIVDSDPRWTLVNMNIDNRVDHSVNVYLNVMYNDDETVEELYLNFVSENV